MSSEIFKLQKNVRIKDDGILSSPFLISLLLLALVYYYVSLYTPLLHLLASYHIDILQQISYLSLLHFYIHFPSNVNKNFTVKETCFMIYLARLIADCQIRSLWQSIGLTILAQGIIFFLFPPISAAIANYISYGILVAVSINQHLQYRSCPFSDPEIITFKEHFYSKNCFSQQITCQNINEKLVLPVDNYDIVGEVSHHENNFS